MTAQPTKSQLEFAQFSKRIARTGVQARLGTDYIEKCFREHRPTQCHITFARYYNPGHGHWVQLTITRRTGRFEAVPIPPALEESWLLAFFGDDRPKVRTDLASSNIGRMLGTRHYRLFTDENYRNAYIPQKDVCLD